MCLISLVNLGVQLTQRNNRFMYYKRTLSIAQDTKSVNEKMLLLNTIKIPTMYIRYDFKQNSLMVKTSCCTNACYHVMVLPDKMLLLCLSDTSKHFFLVFLFVFVADIRMVCVFFVMYFVIKKRYLSSITTAVPILVLVRIKAM